MEVLTGEALNGFTVADSNERPADKVGEELERILRSRLFRRASRLKDLLRYVVLAAVDGHSSDERRTARELFGRGGDFNPVLDPLIRVQFGRLRKRLAQYYEGEGKADAVVIEIPSRSYTPQFHIQDVADFINGPSRNGSDHGEESEPEAKPAASGLQSVAVLPFANLTTDPRQDAFCYGLTEEIATALAAVPSVNVVASSSAFQFKDEHFDVRDVGRELGVLLILEGSVRVERGQARVTAQLARSADGVAIWSHSFDGKINGSLSTQRVMARKVLERLPVGKLTVVGPEEQRSTIPARTCKTRYLHREETP